MPEHSIFDDLLQEAAKAFNADAIPYMVIGGQAVLVYGEPRLTRDIDVAIASRPEDVRKIMDVAHRLGWRILPSNPESFVHEKLVLPCQHDPSGIRIDLTFAITPFEHAAIARAIAHDVGGVGVRFATVEDLLTYKLVAGRPRDLEDARSLILKNPKAELTLVRELLHQIDSDRTEEFLARLDQVVGTRRL